MTDAEINLAIAKIEYPNRVIDQHQDVGAIVIIGTGFKTKDYVNNWADIGEIIEREKIALSYDGDVWFAYGLGGRGREVGACEKTPTKAAALCFLKIRGVEI